jgi:hypothetical protein
MTLNLSQLCRQILVINHQVRVYQVAALMPAPAAAIKLIRRREGLARQERKRLCALIRAECRLRVDAWDHGRPYSQIESTKRFTARQGTRGR